MGRYKNWIATAILLAVVIIPILFVSRGPFVKSDPPETSVASSAVSNGQAKVRNSAVSGQFYPSDAEVLRETVSDLISKAQAVPSSQKPRILISPHAGVEYSGATAAASYKQIEGAKYTRVIIIGTSHNFRFDDAVIDGNDYWETPLGQIKLDKDYINTLVQSKKIGIDSAKHAPEHSLEMQLIFLQQVLGNGFEVVPILMSDGADMNVINLVAYKIAQNFDDNTLLVVSSDLSHYPKRETARQLDNKLIKSILTGDLNLFEETVKDTEMAGYADVATAACASEAIAVGMKVSKLLGFGDFQKLKYENTGDVTGDNERVVGYGALIARNGSVNFNAPVLDEEAQRETLQLTRSTLEEYLKSGKTPEINPQNALLYEPLGAFVTLEINGQLRGCIGSFEPDDPLYKVLQQVGISAAVNDGRFTPVKYEELKDIDIEISVMTPRIRIDNWKDIVLGEDGVVIQDAGRAGTFLPQVATDNNWDLETFLSELCSQKVGVESDCYRDPQAQIYTFEAQVFGEKEVFGSNLETSLGKTEQMAL
jgi:AmmeMemoRadiSam system protein B/AmmeMemoRadiSam system protein A